MDHPGGRCLACGYSLRGLARGACPECGRAFDPADPTTFDSRPAGWRRRRRIRTAVVLALIVLVLVAPVFPRRLLRGHITLQCVNCGIEQTAYRWEPLLPQWVGLRMPGLHWRTGLYRGIDDTRGDCNSHAFFNVKTEFDFPVGSAKANWTTPQAPTMNGRVTTPDTSLDVLHNLMSPSNTGIGP